VPVGVTGHRTQRPRGQVGPPGPHPAQTSSPLDPGGERWPISPPLAPLIAQLAGQSRYGKEGLVFSVQPLQRSADRYSVCALGDPELESPGKLSPLDADVSAVHSWPTDRGKLSCRGPLPLLCAPALRGPRVSSATWHRLGGLLRGNTWPRRCTPSACTSQVLRACLLGAPPTVRPLGEPNAMGSGLSQGPQCQRAHGAIILTIRGQPVAYSGYSCS
jgi:hypothetical protein